MDFFLHFTHDDYIEEFGRNIMEAMAAGKVTILPHVYKDVFGDAAVYCKPNEVSATVLQLWKNHELYSEQALRGFNFVRDNCEPLVVEEKLLRLLNR